MTNPPLDEEQIFHTARDISDRARRRNYLKMTCDGDSSLRERIEALLDVHEETNGFLNSNAAQKSTADVSPGGHSMNEMIGPYKLIHMLGEGGMGTVYLAEQSHPVKRRVALKVVKQGLNTQQFIARFEAERQALAMMDHPNIAKVLDAGCTDDGRNYFVMELVKGIPITQFCDDNRLNTEERLKLFVDVCKAVQHAHQKGIIHRDLKPSNVMVALYDDKPVPKVIDFGVAKATQQPLTEQTLCTIPGQIVGTWEYMSPEQAILNQLDVDTRTDIYSLGVILYELLTGQTPLDLRSLKPEHLEERLRRIREQEPIRPSNRVSSLGDAATLFAAYRNTEVETISNKLRGDLDWVVMKALEKDRSNRYETANGFAAEIGRYLNDEPLSFRPPTAWNQFQRLYRRNRTLVSTAAIVFAAVTIALGVSIWAIVGQQTAINAQRVLEKSKKEAFKQVLERAKIQAMDAALAAKYEDVRGHLETIRLLGEGDDEAEGWAYLVEAQIADQQGDYERCQSLTQKAVERLPNSTSAIAFEIVGKYDMVLRKDNEGLAKRIDMLESLEAKTFYDLLFKASALRLLRPEKALEYIEQAINERPEINFAWTVRARAQLSLAEHKPFSKEGLELLKQAIEEIEINRRRGYKTVDLLGLLLFVQIDAIRWSREIDVDAVETYTKAAEETCKALQEKLQEKNKGGLSPHLSQVRYWICTNQIEVLRDEISSCLDNDVAIDPGVGVVAALHLTQINPELALKVYELSATKPPNSTSLRPILRTWIELSSNAPDYDRIRKEYRNALQGRTDSDAADWYMLRMLGVPINDPQTIDVPKKLFASSDDPDSWICEYLNRHIRGDLTKDQFLKSVAESVKELQYPATPQRGVAIANFWIGLNAFEKGDRDTAVSHFKQAIDSDRLPPHLQAIAKIYHQRIKDPNWLPSKDVKSEED